MKNNIFKKLIASALCLSFMTLQTTFAESVIPVLPDNGSGGAQINGSHGGFTGVEKPDSNNANLNFNGDAVLDWGFLNVGKNQSLNFINGNWAVLNNVLNGMSTIAGSITGQTGKIIISNPNGMLMTGGSISTAGTLVLTTQDLTGKYSFSGGNLNINYDYLNNPVFKDNTYNVIALNNGSISGADINIIAKGIDVKDSNIAGKNISLVTKDGSTFFAGSNNATFNNQGHEIKFENGNSIQVANSSIKAKNGKLELVADGAGSIIDNTTKGSIESGLGSTVSAKKVTVKGGTFKGDTTLTSTVNAVEVNRGVDSKTNITDGNLTVNSKKSTTLKNVIVSGLGKGDIKVDSNQSASLTNTESNKLDVTAVGAIDVNNAKVHDNANIKNTGTTLADSGNIMINGGKFDKDLNINSTRAIGINYSGTTNTTVDGNLTATSTTNVNGFNNIKNVTVGKKLTAKANSNNHIVKAKATDMDLNSGYYSDVIDSEVTNNLTATTGTADGDPMGAAWKDSRQFYMENTKVGKDLTATSETGFVHINGGSIDGNAVLNANTKGTGSMGDIIIGYSESDTTKINSNPSAGRNSTTVAGTVTAKTKNGSNTTYGKGNVYAYSDNKLTISDSNVDNDLIAETKNGNLMLNGGHIKGDAKLTSGKAIGINYGGTTNTTVDGNLTATSTTDVNGFNNIKNVTVGKKLTAKANSNNHIVKAKATDMDLNSGYYSDVIDSEVTNNLTATTGTADGDPMGAAWKDSRQFYMENTKVGKDLTATSETGFVHINGGSIDGNAVLNANTKGTGSMGDIIIGYSESDTTKINSNPSAGRNSTTVAGTVTAKTKNGSNTTYGKGNVYAYSDNKLTISDSNVDNDLIAETKNGNLMLNGGHIKGDAKLTSGKAIGINYGGTTDTTVDGNLTATSTTNVNGFNNIKNVTVGKKLTAKANSNNHIVKAKATDMDLNSGYYSDVIDSEVTNNLTATTGTADGDPMGAAWKDSRQFYMENTKVGKDLTATSETGFVHINGGSIDGNAVLNANTKGTGSMGDIIIGYSESDTTKINSNPSAGRNSTTVAGTVTAKTKNGSNTTYGKGNVYAYSDNKLTISDSNVDNDLIAETKNGNLMLNGGHIKGDAKLTSGKAIGINYGGTTNTTVDGNLTATSTTDVNGFNNIKNVTVGKKLTAKANSNNHIVKAKATDMDLNSGYYSDVIDSEVTNNLTATTGTADGDPMGAAWKDSRQFYMENTKVGKDLTATSETGFVHINGGSIDGNAVLNANTKGTGSMGDIIIGYSESDTTKINSNPSAGRNSTTVAGTVTAKTKNGSNTTYGKGNVYAYSDNKLTISDSNVDNDLIAETKNGNLMLNGGHIKGDAKLTSGKAIGINYGGTTDTTVDGNLTATSTTNVNGFNNIKNVTVGKKLTAKANSNNHIVKAKATDMDLNSGYYSDVIDSEVTNNLTATTGTADGDPMGAAWKDSRQFYMENTKVGKDLTATSETGFVHINGGSIDGNAVLNANTKGTGSMGDIIIGYSESDTTKINSNPSAGRNSTTVAGTVTAKTKNGSNTTYGKGNVYAYSDNKLTISDSNVDNDLIAETKNGNLMLNGGHIKGDAKLTSGKAIGINYGGTTDTTVDGNLTATSTTNVNGFNNIKNVTVGKKLTAKANSNNHIVKAKATDMDLNSGYYSDVIDSEVTNNLTATTGTADGDPMGAAWKDSRQFYMENTKVGKDLTATSETGFVHINGGSIDGNAVLNANTKGTGSMGDIIIGYSESDTTKINSNPSAGRNSTTVAGTVTAKTKNGSNTTYGKGNVYAYSDGDLSFVNSNVDNDMMVETTGKTSITDSVVNGILKATSTNGDVYLANSTLKQTVDINAKNDADIILNDIADHLNADAGNNINYVTRGDILLNDSTDMNLNAGNVAKITTNGDITVDNLSAGTTVVKAKTIDLNASNITTNDSTYNANVKMTSAGDVTFTGDNEVKGDLTVITTGDESKVAMNGNSTKAKNITVDMTADVTGEWAEFKNVETGHLQLNNFNIGHLIESVFDTVGFNNGETLYVNILNTVVDGQIVKDLDPVIEGNRTDVNRVIYYPLSVTPGGGTGGGAGDISGDDAARLMGYMREKGIDGLVGKDFAPIAFAAYDRGKRGAIFKAAGDAIYKDVSQVVHITDRFNLDD